MASPVWQTTAGLLGVINERDFYSVTLSATDSDGDSLTYSKIAGTLPTGIELTSAGVLQGVPTEVSTRSLYTFVIRVSDGTNVADRTFSLQVQGADAPVFATAAGELNLADSTQGRVNRWVLDGSLVNFRVQATDTDTAAGQTLFYFIQEGELPPGLKLTSDGLITGTVLLTDDERYGPIGGYDNFYKYDDVGYDMSSAPNRRPVFETDSSLGSFRHDNNVVIKIDVVDFDPLQGDLNYSIQSGSLPTGLSIDVNTGEISGQLPTQSAVSVDHTFTVRASRIDAVSGVTIFGDKEFTMTVIGEIDTGISFVSPTNLGTVTAGIPSLINIEASAVATNRVLEYTVTTGSLPTGLTLSRSGNIIGKVDKTEFTTVDDNEITFDTNSLSFDRKYTFTVTVGDQYQSLATSKEFTLTVSLPYGVEYGNMSAQGLIPTGDRDLFYQIAQDPNINSNENIFRPEDNFFGIQTNPEMLLISGLEHKTLTELQQQMEQNHTPKSLYFGEIKTAVAKENGKVKYEVVYVEMKDNLVNNSGEAVASSVTLRTDIVRPLIGGLADGNRITADYDVYDVTTDGGLSFSIAGSKIRYANQLTADTGTFEKLFPNAVANMRTRMKSLGQREYVHLPLWMRTSQDNSGVPLGYKMAMVLAYCKPNKSGLVKKRIQDKTIDFKKLNFVIDRYKTTINKVDTGTLTADGSTTQFTLNEIVNEEEIKVRENAVVYSHGQQVRADNNLSPSYLSADSLLRSADYEPQFSLSHDTTNKKTTINFTNAPTATSKIRVERLGDKYLAFKKKLKE